MSKILIIEDDPYVRRMYKRLFAFQNHQVDMAENGEEGLKKAKSSQPSLILLDVVMPGMNGLEVLKKLKKDPETAGASVLLLTNFGEEATVKEATSLGAEGVLVKSNVSPEEVIDEVNKRLRS